MNEDDRDKDHDSLGTCHVQYALLLKRGTASSNYVGLLRPVPCRKPRHADDGPCAVFDLRASANDGG
eukprot:4878457-Pyramimonas_sp.AAC.2